MQKKILALLLTVVVASLTITTPNVSAQTTNKAVRAEQVIEALEILNTDEGGDNPGTKVVTRGQYAQMLINMSTFKATATADSKVSLFSDVSKTYWAAGYIQTAITQGWMSGYLNGTFKPNQAITLKEAVNGIVKLLGYANSDFTGNISSGQMALYTAKDLDENITQKKNDKLTRNNCMNLFYNTLTATTKDGKIYGETLGYKLDADGEIDYLSLVNLEMKGPILVDNSWRSKLPFTATAATYYRNGEASDISDLEDYDVIYYSENQKSIWAYSKKVTGRIQTVTPNRLAPTAVTIAGTEYALGTSDMSIEFSTLGSVEEGKVVTLLFGKDDSVVDVLQLDEYNTTITGVVLDTGEHLSADENENLVYTDYVIIVDAEGNEYEQDYDKADLFLTEGDLARVTYIDGVATVFEYSIGVVNLGSNTFSSDGSMLGNHKLASNVKILDIIAGKYVTVYPERLVNVALGSNTLYYYEMNSDEEITGLMLNNVTGDLYDYGILTAIDYGQKDTITYSYLIDGEAGSITSESVSDFDLEIGPKGFAFDGTKLVATAHLTEIPVLSLGESTLKSSSMKFTLADEIEVYYFKDGAYYVTTLEKVSDLTKYELTAYYDRTVSTGGQVRVILAEDIN